jgi:chromate transporter
VDGAALGMGAAVAAVALNAAIGLIPTSWRRAGPAPARRTRWVAFVLLGAFSAATIGPFLVLVLLGCGTVEVLIALHDRPPGTLNGYLVTPLLAVAVVTGGIGALIWVAFKVGALSYGGGFVIVPLMQADAVTHYHWMTNAQFLNAVALGQVTPGPVVLTVVAIGFAAAGIGGAALATVVAFLPSFVFVIAGGRRFDLLRDNSHIQAFLTGAGATVIGAITGSAIPLGLALSELWQFGILAAGAVWLLLVRRGVVSAILLSAAVGVAGVLLGAPAPS